jgi:hypothetical protein
MSISPDKLTLRRRDRRGGWTRAATSLSLTVTVLLALLVDRAFLRTSPAEADDYHAAVRGAVEALPVTNGPWLGVDVPVPEAAVRMLHPNVILSRRFTDISTGEAVTFLLVQVRDARDTLGHYPPVCYPGQGWRIQSATPADWSDQRRVVHGTEYVFARDRADGSAKLVVDNFLMLPGGQTCRDMDAVELAAQDRRRKFFGAAQVQLVFGGDALPARRRQVVERFLGYAEPAFEKIGADVGEKHEQ